MALLLFDLSMSYAYTDDVDLANASGCQHFYKEIAKNLKAKAKEQEQLLKHYEDKSYLYGKRAQDLQAHTWALMQKYQRDSIESLNKATDHRQIDCKLDKTSILHLLKRMN